jgi:hypothetical protein
VVVFRRVKVLPRQEEISSVFRRIALDILQRDTSLKASIRCKRKLCGWDETAFEKLIACFSEN